MPLNGTAFASWADRFAVYAEGKTPLSLTPVRLECGVAVATGEAAVSFIHDGEEEGAEPTEGVLLRMGELDVRTRTRLAVGDHYTYAGFTWQVAPTEKDVMAGVSWQYGAKLVRHAG